ncbi:hypothetical protein [Streptomyces paradoxus]|uniref:hypothetical protein n=1 Tax=Streptomyces paradoxus TaxID=66375 RepID=UPI0037D11C8B
MGEIKQVSGERGCLLPRLHSRIRGRPGIAPFNPETVERMNGGYAGSEPVMADPFTFPGGHDLRRPPPTLPVNAGCYPD